MLEKTYIIQKIQYGRKKIFIYINDEKLEITPDIYTNFYLYENKTLDEKTYVSLCEQSAIQLFLAYAYRLLARRAYTKYEISQKLYHRKAKKWIVHEVISHLEKGGLIDDKKYLEEYLSFYENSLKGQYKIAADLRKKGLEEKLIKTIKIPSSQEEAKIHDLLPRLLQKYAKGSQIQQKNSVYEYLFGKGFPAEVIEKAFRETEWLSEEKEIKNLIQEITTLKRRLGKKNQDSKISETLARKGYNYTDIKKYLGAVSYDLD